jgi:desulfoferrodoxin (superoxide reductase-like protein)
MLKINFKKNNKILFYYFFKQKNNLKYYSYCNIKTLPRTFTNLEL